MEPKYEILRSAEHSIQMQFCPVYRIRALRSFGAVKAGDLGGFVLNEDNLSHDGLCWIGNDAVVMDKAQVKDNGGVWDNAVVSGRTQILNSSQVSGNSRILGTVTMIGHSSVQDNAVIAGGDTGLLLDHSQIYNDARIDVEGALIHSRVYGHAEIEGQVTANRSRIHDNASVSGAIELDSVRVFHSASVHGEGISIAKTRLSGTCRVRENAQIRDSDDILWFTNVGSEDGVLTVYRGKNDILMANRGCFHGTLKQFEDAVLETHGEGSKYHRQYGALIQAAQIALRP